MATYDSELHQRTSSLPGYRGVVMQIAKLELLDNRRTAAVNPSFLLLL
jgi:hypothetical protein